MAKKPLPSQEVLRQLLDYDPDTGALTWRKRGVEWFPAKTPNRSAALCRLWNKRYAGKPAFTCVANGYFTGSIAGSNYKSHRVIWKMATSEDPDEVDHINGDRADNRLANLRSVNSADNARNRKISSVNKSGIVGVHKWAHGKSVYWVATWPAKKGGTYFHCIGQAIRARNAAGREHGFHENHGRTT